MQLSRNPLAGFMITVGMVAFCCVLISAASAQTPDGQTPAGESVCDALQAEGVTRGLYGLCVAFCEAQDWESCPTAPETCGTSAGKILATYDRMRRPADPDMPCIVRAPTCPCWDGSAEAFPGGTSLADLWVANAPDHCGATDACQDEASQLLGFQRSMAFCALSHADLFVTLAFSAPQSAPSVGFCQVRRLTAEGDQAIFLTLDGATAERCLAEHDAFTAGGTFPFYTNHACGLPRL